MTISCWRDGRGAGARINRPGETENLAGQQPPPPPVLTLMMRGGDAIAMCRTRSVAGRGPEDPILLLLLFQTSCRVISEVFSVGRAGLRRILVRSVESKCLANASRHDAYINAQVAPQHMAFPMHVMPGFYLEINS